MGTNKLVVDAVLNTKEFMAGLKSINKGIGTQLKAKQIGQQFSKTKQFTNAAATSEAFTYPENFVKHQKNLAALRIQKEQAAIAEAKYETRVIGILKAKLKISHRVAKGMVQNSKQIVRASKNETAAAESVIKMQKRRAVMSNMGALSYMFLAQKINASVKRIGTATIGTFREITEGQTQASMAMTGLTANITALKFAFGNALSTALLPMIPALIEIITNVINFIDENPRLVTTAFAFLAIAGAVLSIWANLKLLKMGEVMSGLGTALKGPLGVALLIVAAIVAIGIAGENAIQKFDNLKESSDKMGSEFKEMTTDLGALFVGLFTDIDNVTDNSMLLASTWSYLKALFIVTVATLGTGLAGLFAGFKQLGVFLAGAFTKSLQIVAKQIRGLVRAKNFLTTGRWESPELDDFINLDTTKTMLEVSKELWTDYGDDVKKVWDNLDESQRLLGLGVGGIYEETKLLETIKNDPVLSNGAEDPYANLGGDATTQGVLDAISGSMQKAEAEMAVTAEQYTQLDNLYDEIDANARIIDQKAEMLRLDNLRAEALAGNIGYSEFEDELARYMNITPSGN